MSIEIADETPAQSPTEVQAEFEAVHAETEGQGKQALAILREDAHSGFRFVYNRLPQKFEKFFDGRPYKWEANEERSLPSDIAEFMYRNSVVSYEPVTGTAVRALVTTADEKYGVPYVADLGPELMSREVSDNYTQIPAKDGLVTKAKIVTVKGGGYDQGRPIGTSRL